MTLSVRCLLVAMISKSLSRICPLWFLCMLNLSLNILQYHQTGNFMTALVDCMQKTILHKMIDFVLTYVFGFQHVICTGLWCKVESEKECKTKLDPPMDGTDCDTGKVCLCWKSNINHVHEHLTVKETSWKGLCICLKFLLTSAIIKIIHIYLNVLYVVYYII